MGLFSGISKLIGSVTKAVAPVTSLFSGGSLLGSALTAGASYFGQTSANQANSAQAARQMQFQQYNSDTAYQRATADMRAAGINPMLAYQQGGASTPSGAQANIGDSITPALSTAAQVSRTKAEIDNMEKTNQNLGVENERIKSDTALNKASAIAARASAATSAASAAKIRQEIKGAETDAEWRQNNKNAVGFGNWMNAVSGGVLGGTQAAHSAKGLVTPKGRINYRTHQPY